MAKTYIHMVPCIPTHVDFIRLCEEMGKKPQEYYDDLACYIPPGKLQTAYHPGPEVDNVGDAKLDYAPSRIDVVIWDGRPDGDAWYLQEDVQNVYKHKKTGKLYVNESVVFPDQ